MTVVELISKPSAHCRQSSYLLLESDRALLLKSLVANLAGEVTHWNMIWKMEYDMSRRKSDKEIELI